MRALSICLAISLAAPAFADELDSLAKAIDEHPEDSKTYDAYALAAFKAKRFDDAIKRLKVGVARIPEYGEGYYKLAFAYRQKKEWADAADYYRRYIALNPQKTDPYFGLGAALEGLGDVKGAIAAFDKYVSLEKSPAKQRFIDDAKNELSKLDPSRAPKPAAPPPPVAQPTRPTVTPAGPPRAEAPALRAQADELRKQGKLEEASQAYQRAIEADRGNLDLYNDLGNVYFSLKRYNEAAQAFQDATARDPNFSLGWYNLAHALRKGGRNQEAVTAYRQYMRLRPDDPDPYYGLGQTLKAVGDLNGAIEAFRKYVSMEKRPDEQRWVDKARAELQALEAMQKPSSSPSGKIEEKSSEDRALRSANEALDRELERDAVLPLGSGAHDDLIDPFRSDGRIGRLRDPFAGRIGDEDALIDPYSTDRRTPRLLDAAPTSDARTRIRAYGAALAEYRRALSAQVEDVSLRYERGAAAAMANDTSAAMRAWNAVRLLDPRVDAARRSVEKARALFARR